MILEQFASDRSEDLDYSVIYSFSEQIMAYSYGVKNLCDEPREITLDFSQSKNIIFGGGRSSISKIVLPGQVEFMMHTMVKPGTTNFKRSAKCQSRYPLPQK